MVKKTMRDFCIECREETEYILKEEERVRFVKGKEYPYRTIVAYCKICGEQMSIPELSDKDMELFDAYYRKAEGIITIPEIKKLMELYHLGKAPLSLALGFGEITVSRYLEGQVPTRRYSDVMRKALHDPEYMLDLLKDNKDKIGEAAYKKAYHCIQAAVHGMRTNHKIQSVIYYIVSAVGEITPLALQKLLYFAQGLHLGIYGNELFEDNCEAWVHGPVYPDVYNQYKRYGYNPIDDAEDVFYDMKMDELPEDEKRVIDLVTGTFGMYSGKVLENITHKENPWIIAREGIESIEYSRNIISKESMKEYYTQAVKKYGMTTEEGINRYINNMR